MLDILPILLSYLAPPALGLAIYIRFFRQKHLVDALAFAWGFGGILVNLILMTANQVLLIPFHRDWMLYLALAFLLPAAWIFVRNLGGFGSWLRRGRDPLVRGFRHPGTLLLLGPAILFPFMMVKALAYPETAPDSIFYHLFLAKDAFETGQLPRTGGLGWLELSNSYPNLVITQQIWIYFIAGSADQMLSRPLVPLYAVMLAALLVRAGNQIRPGSGPLALLLLASYTVPATVLPEFQTPGFLPFGRLSVEIWTDIPVTFYALLSVHFVLHGFRGGGRLPWAAGGLFAGGAILTKYNGLPFVGFLSLFLLLLLLHRHRGKARPATGSLAAIPAFAIPVSLAVGLLFLRNQYLFGNPLYPFYTDLLGGTNLRSAQILTDFVPAGIEAVKVEQVTVLLSSLLFLLFLPSLSLRGPEYRLLQATAVAYIVYILSGWNFLSAFYRMALPAFPLVALSAGAWFQQSIFESRGAIGPGVTAGVAAIALVLQPNVFAAMALGAIIAIALLHTRAASRLPRGGHTASVAIVLLVLSMAMVSPAVQAVGEAKYPTPVVGPIPAGLPRVADEDVLRRAFGLNWELWEWMNGNLPDSVRVMTLHPGRYYIQAELVCPASVELVAHYDAGSLQEALDILEGAGVTYVLDSRFARDYILTKPFWVQSPIFQNLDNTAYFELVYENPELALYLITG